MFKKDYLESLETKLGYEKGTLTAAASSEEEIEIASPTVIIRTAEDEATRDTNLVEQSRAGILEVGIKKFGQEREFENKITSFETLYSEIESKVKKDLDYNPTERYKTLERKSKEELTARDLLIQNKETLITQMKTQMFSNSVKSGAINGLKTETIIPKEDVFSLFTMRKASPVKLENGSIVAKDVTTGEIMMDKNLVPIPFNDVFNSFVDANYRKTVEGGVGAGGKKDKDGIIVFDNMEEWGTHFGDKQHESEAQKSLMKSMTNQNFKY